MNGFNRTARARCLRTLVILTAATGYVLTTHAQPVVFEESVRLASPDPAYRFDTSLALQGDDLLVTARGLGSEDYGLFHFERQADGTWLSRGQVAFHPNRATYYPNVVASLRHWLGWVDGVPTGCTQLLLCLSQR